MGSSVYDLGLEKILDGEVSWTRDTIRAALVDGNGYSPKLGLDEFLSAIPSDAIVGTSDPLTGKTKKRGIADADDVTIKKVSRDASLVAIYKDTGNPATSPLIALLGRKQGAPFKASGGDVVVRFDDTEDVKIFRLGGRLAAS